MPSVSVAEGAARAQSAFLGSSEGAREVRDAIARASRSDVPVLVVGESGVGKELVAREIHVRSQRHGPFVAVNCSAIPETLIESELFGHAAGAFTDARAAHRGCFEIADHGTLLLDEIGDLSHHAQPKLLRALESGEILPVGAEAARRVQVRIVAATNHDLRAMTRDGSFRTDLYYRIRVVEIRVPPLRERAGDIAELADHFARLIAAAQHREYRAITPSAVELLQSYPWPGNVRELRTAVEQAFVMSSGATLDRTHFTLDPLSSSGALRLSGLFRQDWRTARTRFESAYAKTVLERHEGNVGKAARAAGVTPRSLYKMLERLGLRPGKRFS